MKSTSAMRARVDGQSSLLLVSFYRHFIKRFMIRQARFSFQTNAESCHHDTPFSPPPRLITINET